ncbi:DinB family protein [Kribbella antibiotica]|uniref:DinB family protein n=1 Tax=Kribbella antibiotica TaxID=190195 RepID=A0A4R4ZLS0_9ACTN|nr:DinB family protein [Kribbella antibiotica]
MDWGAEVADQLETHWQELLRPRLDGLTDDEYFWQPVPGCWTLSRRGQSAAPLSLGAGDFTMDYQQPPPDPAPVTTIAWRLAHLSVGLASTSAKRFGQPAASEATYSFAGTAREALRQLDDEYAVFVAGVRGLGTGGLSQPQGEPPAFAEASLAKLMLYVNAEVIHHGAEICLLRDLYLQRT